MDFILQMINDDLEIAEENSIDQCTLLKERVEYCLIMAMGYLYHKNIRKVNADAMKIINENMINMTFRHYQIKELEK